MTIKKPGSKKEQEIENKNLKHKKGQIRTANADIWGSAKNSAAT